MMFAFIPNVYANEIKKITVDVNIDKNANAFITETWEVKGTDGTEWYHPFRNLGESKISDFTVSMDGKPLTYKKWNGCQYDGDEMEEARAYIDKKYGDDGTDFYT